VLASVTERYMTLHRHSVTRPANVTAVTPPLGGCNAVTATSPTGSRLADLASRVDRLSPSHHDPERFHVEKSEIVHDLRRLAGRNAR